MMSSFLEEQRPPSSNFRGGWLMAAGCVSHVGQPAELFCSRYWNQHTKYTECAIHSFLVSSVLDNWGGTTVIVCTTLTIILHSYRVLYTFGRNDGQFSNESVPFENWVGRLYNYIAPAALTHEERKRQRSAPPFQSRQVLCYIELLLGTLWFSIQKN